MKKALKIMILTVLGLLGAVKATQAQTGFSTVYTPGELIIGFSTGSGNDTLYVLGYEKNLFNGETWNLASFLTAYGNFSTLNWGVVGNLTNAGSARIAWTTTTVGAAPSTITGIAAFGKLNTAANELANNFPGNTNIVTAQSASIVATAPSSWNNETLNGTLTTDYVNAYENPNVLGVGSADFSVVTNNGSAPVLLGRFSLAANGTVTFNTISSSPTPPVAGFTGTPTTGFAPLKVIFTDASTGTITNWTWSFGDGHSVTNITNITATNTYAAAGSYNVSLTVIGPGGTNTRTMTAYVVVSPTPKISQFISSAGKVILSGTNGPSGVQYRILTTTNLTTPIGLWKPVLTNNFLSNGNFGYTNSTTNVASFFRLISP